MIHGAKDIQVKLNNFMESTYNLYKKIKNNEIE